MKQYVRDVENALEDLEDAAATAAGHLRTVQRDQVQLQSQINELNRNIDFILTDVNPANDHLAKPLEARLIGLEPVRCGRCQIRAGNGRNDWPGRKGCSHGKG